MNNKNLWVSFWPLWILANGLGWFLINLVSLVPFWPAWATISIGLLLSLLQWLVLTKYIGVDSSWIWVGTITYGVFFFIVFVTGTPSTDFGSLIPRLLGLGLLSIFQYFVLNSYVNDAAFWIVVSPIAGFMAWTVAQLLSPVSSSEPSALYWLVVGIMYGCITGWALIFMQTATTEGSGNAG